MRERLRAADKPAHTHSHREEKERDDEIISVGMCFAPESQNVLRLSELCRVSGTSRSTPFANTLSRWRSISLILQTTNDNATAKLADAAMNNNRKQWLRCGI